MNSEEKQRTRNQHTLSQKAYWTVNKRLAREIGHLETILLSEFIYREEQALEHNLADEEGFFSFGQGQIKEYTAFSAKVQKRCCDKLEEAEILLTKHQGIPRKKWYRINHSKIDDILKTSEKGKPNKFRPKGDTDKQAVSPFGRNLNRQTVETVLPQQSKQDSTEERSYYYKNLNKNKKQESTITTTPVAVVVDIHDPFFQGLNLPGVRPVWFQHIVTKHKLVSVDELKLAIQYLQSDEKTNNPESMKRSLEDGWPFLNGYSKYEPASEPSPVAVPSDPADVEAAVKAILEQRITSKPNYGTWIHPLRFEKNGTGWKVVVPNEVFSFQLNNEGYIPMIREAFTEVLGTPTEVTVMEERNEKRQERSA